MLDRAPATSGQGPSSSPSFCRTTITPGIFRARSTRLSQDRPADEIIVIDDCSADASREIVTRYAATHPSIRLVSNDKNMGVIPTLSRGLNEARGQLIYFGAADDFVMPGFFTAAIKMLRAHPTAGLFSGDAVLVDGQSGRSLGVRPRCGRGLAPASSMHPRLRGCCSETTTLS